MSREPLEPDSQRWLLLTCLVILVVTDLVLIDQRPWTVLFAAVAVAAMAWLAWKSGLTLAQLGLDRQSARAGALWGVGVSAMVIAGLAVAISIPALAGAFEDGRTPQSAAAVVAKVAWTIPVRTVILEEFAFRGLLWGALERRHSAATATAVSSALFGLWHLPPAFLVMETNQALADFASTPASRALIATAVVMATAVAGVFFAELRRRSGSLLAPMAVHWTTNSISTIMGALRQ